MNEENLFEPIEEMPQYEYSDLDVRVKASADKIAFLVSQMNNAEEKEWRKLQESLMTELEFASKNILPMFKDRKGINDELLKKRILTGYRLITESIINGVDTAMSEDKWNQNDIDAARADMQKIETKIIPDLIELGLKKEAHKLNATKEMVDLKISNDL